jgi:hypothetical protein
MSAKIWLKTARQKQIITSKELSKLDNCHQYRYLSTRPTDKNANRLMVSGIQQRKWLISEFPVKLLNDADGEANRPS